MSTDLSHSYQQLCNMATECHKLFVAHKKQNVENSIDALLKQMDIVLHQQPHLLGLVLNTSNKNMHFGALLILKQAFYCQSLCNKSRIAQEQVHSIIKASLLLMYVIFPDLIAAKKNREHLPKYKKALIKCPAVSFVFAQKLKIVDNITLKLLSQISCSNTYFNTNMYIQTLVVASVNVSLSAFCGFKQKVPYVKALSQLLAGTDTLQIRQPQLQAYKADFSHFCAPIIDLNGSLARLKNKNLALIVEQTLSDSKFGIFEFSQTSLSAPSELQFVEQEQVRILLPHQIVEHEQLIPLFGLLDDTHHHKQSEEESEHHHKISGINRYSASPSWRVIAKSFVANNKTLAKILANYPEQSRLLLNYASSHNRQQQTVTDISHAINMLGSSQLFAILCNDNIKVKQASVKQMGTDVVNYKIDLFGHILSELHHHNHLGLPKFHELIGRILAIALMTIPKVSYAASTPARLANPNGKKLESMAELFGLSSLDNWKKISLMLSKSWLLPKKYLVVIEQYFDLLSSNAKLDENNLKLNENTMMIIVGTYFFQHLINGETTLLPNPLIDKLLSQFKSIKLNANQLYYQVNHSIICQTPLT